MLAGFKPAFIVLVAACLSFLLEGRLSAEKRDGAFLYLPYFTYAEAELAPLAHLESGSEMSRNELSRWDKETFHLIYQNAAEEQAPRIEAYLYVAQREAACLSYRLRKHLEGSFDPVSRKALALFFPFLQAGQGQNEAERDAYSETLADIVIAKIKARLQEDLRNSRPYPIKKGSAYWAGKEPFWGLDIGSWKPWILLSGDQFRLSAPPDGNLFWQEQLQAVKSACENTGEDKKGLVYFWAGISRKGPSQSGDWLKIANDYMWNQHIPLPQMLLVRATLAMGIEDAMIAAFDSKYTYWIKRPSMLDNQLKTLIAVPNHPSYPSGHSTIASASRAILAYFFPQSQLLWDDLAHEAGWSRIWCGLHFPIDNQAGNTLGEKIGQAAIQAIQNDQFKGRSLP